jgi:hypothetical protein
MRQEAPTPESVGRIELCPDGPIVAGAHGTWRLTYTAGASGIEVGGGLRIFPPHKGHTFWELGKVTTRCSREGATVDVETFNAGPYTSHHSNPPHIRVTVYGEPLAEGDTITGTIGERGGDSRGYFGLARATDHAWESYPFEVFVDVLGNGARPREFDRPDAFVELEDAPEVEVIADAPARLHVIARPPGGPDDDSVSLVISARDEYGNLADYSGTLKVECTDPAADVPDEITVEPEDGGCRAVEGLSVSADAARITVYDPARELIGTSNVAAPGFAGDEHIYFGDLHVMTGTFGGGMLANTEYAYRWARDVQGLDFSVVTNSGREGTWEYDREMDALFDDPGRFVTIPALERGWRQGHKNIYYRDGDQPAMPALSIEEMWEWLEGRQALVIAHHPNCHSETSRYYAWGPQDWATHNPKYERLAEICQARGSFEVDEVGGNVYLGGLGASIQDALALGLRVGFVGGTDNHRAQPGSTRSSLGGLDADEIVGGAITGIFAPELTREALWDALHARRCYATTARRILLDVRMGERFMGSDLRGDDAAAFADSRTLSIRAIGHRDLDRVDVVRNNVTIESFPVSGDAAEIEYTDDTPLVGITPASEVSAGLVYYYVRVIQQDGNMAWSSPIWLAD